MPRFKITLLPLNAKAPITKIVERSTARALEDELAEKQTALLKIARIRLKDEKPNNTSISLKQKISFFHQMGTTYKVGLPLKNSLDLIESTTSSKKLKQVVGKIRQNVERGKGLSLTMEDYPKIFDPISTSITASGENTGTLGQACQQVNTALSRSYKVQKKVQSVMVYPTLVMCLTTVILTLLLWKVVPVFAGLFKTVHIPLPAPTALLVNLGDFIQHQTLLALAIAIGLIIFFVRAPKILMGLTFLHPYLLRVPVFGTITQKKIMANFARTFSQLNQVGVPNLQALQLTRDLDNNLEYRKIIGRSIIAIRNGRKIATCMDNPHVFSREFSGIIRFGEETAQLTNMLSPLADTLDEELDTLVEEIKPVIETIMIVVIGLIVGFVLISLFLPIFQIGDIVRGQTHIVGH